MNSRVSPRTLPIIASCLCMFWIGAFIFGLPGVMAPYWQNKFQVEERIVSQTLFWILVAIGSFMFVAGRLQERYGPTVMVALGTFIMGVNTIFLGWYTSIIGVYAWAFSMGMASTFLYLPSLTVVQRWHPMRRGLVTGLVNLVFGISASFMSPVFNKMLAHFSPILMTAVLGALALATGFAVSPYMKFPHMSDQQFVNPTTDKAPVLGKDFSVKQSLQTKNFWLLWLTWALAGGAGFAMVTLSTLFGLQMGLNMNSAVIILSAFGLTNGLSRIVSGYISDWMGRNITMTISFFLAGTAYIIMPHIQGVVLWSVTAAFIGYGFGTLFAVSAPLATDCFGLKHFGSIFGLVFTAYGFIAGPLGPILSGYLLEYTTYDWVFGYLGVFFLISSILIWFVKPSDYYSSIRIASGAHSRAA